VSSVFDLERDPGDHQDDAPAPFREKLVGETLEVGDF
jgi:hypothetical protein